MVQTPEIDLTPKQLEQLRERLRDPSGLLTAIGSILLAESQAAFRDQKFGDAAWPQRYPNQSTNFLNVAGAVQDLATGARIKARRFDRRPAGIDTGRLRNSLALKIEGDTAVIGSTLPYAGRFHKGGQSEQVITSSVRQNLAKVLKTERNRSRRKKDRPGPRGGLATPIGNRLGFLFQTDTLTTTSPARPFVGITANAEREIDKLLRGVTERVDRDNV